jgi:hypothetical protein
MSEPDEIVATLDGDDAFPDFGNPEWVKKMMEKAEARKAQAAASAKSKHTPPQPEAKPSPPAAA